MLSGVPLIPPPPTLTLYTDASCQGWGAFLEGKSVAGIWSPSHQLDHINLLEMRAVLLALQHFRADLRSKSLLIANRQHHSSGLPTETRRHSVCIPVSSLQRDSATVRFPVYKAVCSSHSGQTEHSSGHVVEVSDSSEHRMGNFTRLYFTESHSCGSNR